MSNPPDSLKVVAPVEETARNGAVPLTTPMSPTRPRRFLSKFKLFGRRSPDSADVVARSPVEGEVESRLKQEVQQLRSRVEELENDKRMSDCKQQEIEELTAKCTAEEKRRREAEGLMKRSDEARRQAEEERGRAEEARRRAEEACRLAEEGRKKAVEDWKQSEEGKKKAEEGRRRSEEGWQRAEYNLQEAQLYIQKNQMETELEPYRQCGATTEDGMAWQHGELHQLTRMAEDEQTKLRKKNEELRKINAYLECENEEYAEEAVCADMELKSLHEQIHHLQAQLNASRRASLERQRQHNGARGKVWRKDSSPLCNSDEVTDCKAVSLEVSCVLQCNNGEAQRHLTTFYRAMDTSSVHAAYKSGNQHRDWRCLAEHIGLHKEDLRAMNSEKRLRIIFDEWDKKESVTVEKVHQVLTASQCIRAAECLLSAAQSMVEQEEGDHILDLGGEGTVQSC